MNADHRTEYVHKDQQAMPVLFSQQSFMSIAQKICNFSGHFLMMLVDVHTQTS